MRYLIFFALLCSSAYAKDRLDDFNKKLLENFQKDLRSDNAQGVRKERVPTRGPASVAPESVIEEEKKIDKTVRQTGHRDW